LIIADLDPTISIGVDSVEYSIYIYQRDNGTRELKYLWKASVSVFTETQARTKRSKVIPGGGPYPAVAAGSEAMQLDERFAV